MKDPFLDESESTLKENEGYLVNALSSTFLEHIFRINFTNVFRTLPSLKIMTKMKKHWQIRMMLYIVVNGSKSAVGELELQLK